jgi:hypothetical protein
MNPAVASAVKVALYGVVLVSLTGLILLQLGTAYKSVKIRTSQPKVYWGIVAVYGAAWMAVVAIFILWR